jgi:gliding motility-associated-like protein
MKVSVIIAIILLVFIPSIFATHNRAGEITYKCDSLNPYKYYFTLTTYTEVSSAADRCELTVYFCGFNDSAVFYRVNGLAGSCQNPAKMGENIGNNVKKNIYEGEHTFSGSILSCRIMLEDPNRNAAIVNISPNSVNIPFFIVSTLSINPFIGCNSSPVLLNPPIDNACQCKKFIHNPGAYDPDGDSLAYKLIKPFQEGGVVIPCYTLPSGVEINPYTGDLTWECPGSDTPAQCGGIVGGLGEYNFAILIEEWRNGQLIGTVERDMQVTVVGGCQNNPPVVEANDTCVVAGTNLNMLIEAYDVIFVGQNGVSTINNVTLEATGGPFLLTNSPAQFTSVGGASSVSSPFSWQTNCSHVRKIPYNVSFKVTDDYAVNKLSDTKTISISVIGPAPVLTAANPLGSTIKLDWLAYPCSNAIGYKIFRKVGCQNSNLEYCETGIPQGLGYTLIATITDINTLTYTDDNNGSGLLYGQEYSYRIFAFFADDAESKASNQKCAMLKRDAPIITNVSIYETSLTTGKDTVRWTKPTEFDSILFPPPYKYLIWRANTSDNIFTLQDSLTNGINDTTYVLDTDLNTKDIQYLYKIEFYTINGRKKIGKSNSASTLRIEATASDNSITLNFNYDVPWTNDSFYVYRESQTNVGTYNFIAKTNSNSFKDIGLINGKTYCYRVLSIGQYSDPTITKPLYNMSQVICAVPKDTTAPCAPNLSVIPDCENIKNTLSWNNPNLTCADDVVKYRIYYTPLLDGKMNLIDSIIEPTTISLIDTLDGLSIAGCYTITAVDSFNNESVFSDTVCVDNCPVYLLPNVFSPNADGVNELFNAFPYKFISGVEMFIYDRWGNLVYETTNPKIAWDGNNIKTKKDCDDGVFYYVCTVKEIRLTGIVNRVLKGFIMKISKDDSRKDN